MKSHQQSIVIYSITFLVFSYLFLIIIDIISSEFFIGYFDLLLGFTFLLGTLFYVKITKRNKMTTDLVSLAIVTISYSFTSGDLMGTLYPSSEIQTIDDIVQVQVENFHIYLIGFFCSLLIYRKRRTKKTVANTR